MSEVVEAVEVDLPVPAVYALWTRFESFPEFMEGVNRVERRSEKTLHWYIEIGGQERDFEAEITEQIPGERVAWRSTDGVSHAGVVTFHHISDTRSRVTLQLEVVPEGAVEQLGDKLGLVKARVKGDMRRFKSFAEPDRSAP